MEQEDNYIDDHTKMVYLNLTHEERNVFVEVIREYAENIHTLDEYVTLFYQPDELTESEKREIEINLRESVLDITISEEEFQEQLENQYLNKRMDNCEKEKIVVLEGYKRRFLQICNELMNVTPNEEGICNLEINEHHLDVFNHDATLAIKKLIKLNPSESYLQNIHAVTVKMEMVLIPHLQKNWLLSFFKFIQLLCRDSEVFKNIFVYLIDEFRFDKKAFYERIKEEPKEFDAPSMNKRYLEIFEFLDKKSWNINWEAMTLDLPDDNLFPKEQLNVFLDELDEYLKTKLDGTWGLQRDVIKEMVLKNTYGYFDAGTVTYAYKEDLNKIPLKN